MPFVKMRAIAVAGVAIVLLSACSPERTQDATASSTRAPDPTASSTPAPDPTAAAAAQAEAEEQAKADAEAARRQFSSGPVEASAADGHLYTLSVSAQVTSPTSLETLNSAVGMATWTPPAITGTVTVTNKTPGHNGNFVPVTIVALWMTPTAADCQLVGQTVISVDVNRVLCPLATVTPGSCDSETVFKDMTPGAPLSPDQTASGTCTSAAPQELTEAQANAYVQLTSNPPDAWYAVPGPSAHADGAISIADEETFVGQSWGGTAEGPKYGENMKIELVGSVGLPTQCATGCKAQASAWGMSWMGD